MGRRSFIMLAVGATLTLALGSSVAASTAGPGKTIRVIEHADTDTVIDLGAAGDSIGDLLAFGNPIYDAKNAQQIGRDEGSCIRTNPGVAWECTWTTILPQGQLTVEGPFLDSGADSVLAITGGTGAYRNARGEMTLHARNLAGTAYDFVFRIIG